GPRSGSPRLEVRQSLDRSGSRSSGFRQAAQLPPAGVLSVHLRAGFRLGLAPATCPLLGRRLERRLLQPAERLRLGSVPRAVRKANCWPRGGRKTPADEAGRGSIGILFAPRALPSLGLSITV